MCVVRQDKSFKVVAAPHHTKAFANEPAPPLFHKLAASMTTAPQPMATMSTSQTRVRGCVSAVWCS